LGLKVLEELDIDFFSIGIMFVGRRYDDDKVLAVANAFQIAAKFDTDFMPLIQAKSDLSDGAAEVEGTGETEGDIKQSKM